MFAIGRLLRNIFQTRRDRGSFSSLYVRDFRVFWIGQIISYSGSWMQSIAQGWLVYSLTKSSLSLGIVAAASTIPFIFFALIGGVVADRLAKRNLIIFTQTLSMLPALILAISTDMKIITVAEVTVIAFSLGIVNAFDIPARQAFLSDMVQKGHLMNAIALNSAAFNGARIIGPVAAGLAIAAFGIAACFYINAASFLAVIIALFTIRGKGNARSRPALQKTRLAHLMRDLAEGLRFVRDKKDIFRTMVFVAVLSLFGIPFVTFLPVFAEDILKVGPKGLGFLAGSTGLGALSAALIIAAKGDVKNKGSFMALAGLVFSAALIVFSLSKNYHLSALALVFSGWGIISFFATANSAIQLSVPDALRGRVMSVYSLVFFGMAPLGNSIIGLISERLGTPAAVSLGASVCLVTSALLMNYLTPLK